VLAGVRIAASGLREETHQRRSRYRTTASLLLQVPLKCANARMRGARIAAPWLNAPVAAAEKVDCAQYGHEPIKENTEVADTIKAEMRKRLAEQPGKIKPRCTAAAQPHAPDVQLARSEKEGPKEALKEGPEALKEGLKEAQKEGPKVRHSASQHTAPPLLAADESHTVLSESTASAAANRSCRRFQHLGAVTISWRSEVPDLEQSMVWPANGCAASVRGFGQSQSCCLHWCLFATTIGDNQRHAACTGACQRG
jgi:hypothetical protein